MNELWTSRNGQELLNILSTFRECTEIYEQNLVLSLELHHWEVFDLRICKPIMRFKYKEALPFLNALRMFKHSLIEVGNIRFRNQRRPSRSQSWALKFLQKYYTLNQITYFLHYENED